MLINYYTFLFVILIDFFLVLFEGRTSMQHTSLSVKQMIYSNATKFYLRYKNKLLIGDAISNLKSVQASFRIFLCLRIENTLLLKGGTIN